MLEGACWREHAGGSMLDGSPGCPTGAAPHTMTHGAMPHAPAPSASFACRTGCPPCPDPSESPSESPIRVVHPSQPSESSIRVANQRAGGLGVHVMMLAIHGHLLCAAPRRAGRGPCCPEQLAAPPAALHGSTSSTSSTSTAAQQHSSTAAPAAQSTDSSTVGQMHSSTQHSSTAAQQHRQQHSSTAGRTEPSRDSRHAGPVDS